MARSPPADPIARLLHNTYEHVLDEPVPEDLLEIVTRLSGPDAARQGAHTALDRKQRPMKKPADGAAG